MKIPDKSSPAQANGRSLIDVSRLPKPVNAFRYAAQQMREIDYADHAQLKMGKDLVEWFEFLATRTDYESDNPIALLFAAMLGRDVREIDKLKPLIATLDKIRAEYEAKAAGARR